MKDMIALPRFKTVTFSQEADDALIFSRSGQRPFRLSVSKILLACAWVKSP